MNWVEVTIYIWAIIIAIALLGMGIAEMVVRSHYLEPEPRELFNDDALEAGDPDHAPQHFRVMI